MPRRGARSTIRRERLRAGLRAIYAWYERNAELAACVLRDAEHHRADARDQPSCDGTADGGLSRGARREAEREAARAAAIGAELFTWRTLKRESGLTQADAVAAMVQAIDKTA